MIFPASIRRFWILAALSAFHAAAHAQYPGPGVPMVPMAPGTPSGTGQVLVAPDGSTTVTGIAVPVEFMNRLNSVISGRTFSAANPLGGGVDLRANDLTPESFANSDNKLASPTPGIQSTDQSTWYPNVQVPGMTSLTNGSAVGGTSNIVTLPAGASAPGNLDPTAPRR